MRTLKLGVCFLDEDDKVISKRIIGTNWGINMEQDVSSYKRNIWMRDEIASILTENLKLQLTPDVIKEMLDEVEEE